MSKLRLFTAVGEAIIPLLGLLFLDWGLYFILLFYCIDLISSEVFLYLKVKKIIQFQKIKFPFSRSYGRILVNDGLVLFLLIIVHLAIYFIASPIDFIAQFIAFLKYEGPGLPIAQGYILFPLVILGSWQQFSVFFVQSGKFRITSWKHLILLRRKALLIAIIGGCIAIVLGLLFSIPSTVFVLLLILGKFGVDLWLGKGGIN